MIKQNFEFRDIPTELLESLELTPVPTVKISISEKRKYILDFPEIWNLCGGSGDYRIAQIKELKKLNKGQ